MELEIPADLASKPLADIGLDELLQVLEANSEGGIRINFAGKSSARRLARQVRPRVTRAVAKLGHGPPDERSRNMLIEGDNLQSMVTLYKERGHVDLILTDPPYNTGNDFRYNDRWDEDPNDPGLGEFVSPDDGARRTKWMRFMWPRLQMMKSMLKPGGVLAICIDHRELFRLGQMLDELFGEENRLAIVNWQKQTSPKNQDTGVSTMTEYVLVYAKDKQKARTGLVPRSEQASSSYRNPDDDPNGDWAPSDSTLMGASTHPGQVYAIQNPFTGNLHYPQEGRCWRNERSKMKAAAEAWGSSYEDRDLADGCHPALLIKGAKDPRGLGSPVEDDPEVAAARNRALSRRETPWPRYFWRADKNRVPGAGELRYKTYLAEVKTGVVPTTFWAGDDFSLLELDSTSWEHGQSGTSEMGKTELNAIVGRGHGFDTVKPLGLFQKIVSIWCPADGLVLDPFAGSGTTGHAVLALNQADGYERRFTLIEQGRPERGDSYAQTLTADRLSRAISGEWANGKGEATGGGYSYIRLGKKVDAAALLRMERDEMLDTVIGSHFDVNRRRGDQLVRVEDEPAFRYLIAKNSDDEGFFLVWGGPDENTDLTEPVYEECAEEAERAGLKPSPYHVYARLYRYQIDGVRFYQIPDRILSDFGLDMRSEPFTEDDDAT